MIEPAFADGDGVLALDPVAQLREVFRTMFGEEHRMQAVGGEQPVRAGTDVAQLRQPAAWIAGTTWRATPAARARAITSSRSRSNSPASTWQWLSTSMASVPAAGLALDGFAAPWPYPLPVGQQQRAEPEQQLVDEGNHVRHEDIADEQRRGQQEQLGIAQPAEDRNST